MRFKFVFVSLKGFFENLPVTCIFIHFILSTMYILKVNYEGIVVYEILMDCVARK